MREVALRVYEIEHWGDVQDARDSIAEQPNVFTVEIVTWDYDRTESALFRIKVRDGSAQAVREMIESADLIID